MRTAICVTPPGRSAIGTIQVTGLDSLDELVPFFSPAGQKKSLEDYPDGRIVFGHWSNRSGTAEELVVTRISDSEVHVHCHGGSAAITAILKTLAGVGFEVERTSRVSWEHPPSDLKSELEYALLRAPTRKIAFHLLEMQEESFNQVLSELSEDLRNGRDKTGNKLQALSDSYDRGQYLARPVRVVLAGPPNVGKSTINNRVLGFDRSIVFDQPGTTRDVVSETTTIGGWSFEFSDTAGIRFSDDAIEAAGVEMAQTKINQADLVVWVQSAELGEQSLGDRLEECSTLLRQPDTKTLAVINKSDLLSVAQLRQLTNRFPLALFTDAKTGSGIGELMSAMKEAVIDPEPKPGEALLFTERQRHLMAECARALESNAVDKAQEYLLRLESDS